MTSQADLFAEHGRSLKATIHTGIPAKVTVYDPLTNTLMCEIVVKEPLFLADGDRDYETYPTLTNVPVQWPRFGGKVIRGMIQPGDWVWLAFSEASLAEWRATGQTSEPVDARRLSIGYPFATPGAFPDSEVMSPTDALEVAAGALIIGEDGGDQILIGGLLPGIRMGQTAVSPVALSVPVDLALAALTTALSALTTALNAHVHTSAAPGSPTTPPVTPMPSAPAAPATVASTLVKAL